MECITLNWNAEPGSVGVAIEGQMCVLRVEEEEEEEEEEGDETVKGRNCLPVSDAGSLPDMEVDDGRA